MSISAREFSGKELNRRIKAAGDYVYIDDCFGQRFIACGLQGKKVEINGTPGNALGAYLDGAVIEVKGNAQDATGDTMNDGKIIIHGNAGDALGYSMRGGRIFVRGNAGYRTGIHMKEYKDKKPVIIVGGHAGSFLGEYLAGGIIVVLGLGVWKAPRGAGNDPVGNFTGTGMHGGKIFIRTDKELVALPAQVSAEIAGKDELGEIEPEVREFANLFGMDANSLLEDKYYILRPNAKNPYKQHYTAY